MEVWKDVVGYEGMYQVSNLGNVKSLDRYVTTKKGVRNYKGKLLSKNINKVGYYSISLSENGIQPKIQIHKLVAMAFLNHKPDGTHKLIVDHINNNSLDNRVDNLQIISQRENSSKDKNNKTSKYTGVCWCKRDNVWQSSIRINGKCIYLGRFKNEYDAHIVYQNKLKELQLNK